jgi:hypothetical protein
MIRWFGHEWWSRMIGLRVENCFKSVEVNVDKLKCFRYRGNSVEILEEVLVEHMLVLNN